MANMDRTTATPTVTTEPETEAAAPASGAGVGETWADTVAEKTANRRMVRNINMVFADAMRSEKREER